MFYKMTMEDLAKFIASLKITMEIDSIKESTHGYRKNGNMYYD